MTEEMKKILGKISEKAEQIKESTSKTLPFLVNKRILEMENLRLKLRKLIDRGIFK
jgi:hypothetical protein